jgi:hypothetical protein
VQTAPIDLEIHGSPVRIVCSDPDGAMLLRHALADHVVSREAPLGFKLEGPSEAGRLAVLTDRCGFVLARTRHVEQALAILGGHLSALLPALPGTVRFKMRAAVSTAGTAALAGFPLLTTPPVVERRLEGSGWRILDRLTVEVDPVAAKLRMPDVPWKELAALDPGPGHILPEGRVDAIRLLLVPALAPDATPSTATVVHTLAGAVVGGADRQASLTAAECLADAVPHHFVAFDQRSAIYDALVTSTG